MRRVKDRQFFPSDSCRRAYTSVEFLITVALLFIVLELMVNLARHVRAASADETTKNLLQRLDEAMALYVRKNGDLPVGIPPLIDEGRTQAAGDEAPLARRARVNNEAVVRLLKSARLFPAGRFEDLSVSYYDGSTVRDAWGNPIVFMPHMDPAVGMAAKGWFFFSAGPDRKYTTKPDNLYSYELPGVGR